MSKKVIVTCGPIPAKLDSVKTITNKFKGELAFKTAQMLSGVFDIQIVKWLGAECKLLNSTHNVEDVYDYLETIKTTPADAYILAAAVANLGPTNPWPGKFPSHLYKEGDKFNIEFTITPRIINRIKQWYPTATLIGYKLFDGTEVELLKAAWELLVESRANVIFANHPATAKTSKIAVMPDGSTIRMSFDEHVEFIKRVINLEWYHTVIVDASQRYIERAEPDERIFLAQTLDRISVMTGDMSFGTVAAKLGSKILTTTRGKRNGKFCSVYKIDHTGRTVYADDKATLNAPALSALFDHHAGTKYILHGHRQIQGGVKTHPYVFSGTTEETQLVRNIPERLFNIENHGYYICFKDRSELLRWVNATY